MRENEPNIVTPRKRTGVEKTGYRSRCIVGKFDQWVRYVPHELMTTIRGGRMEIDHRLPAIELIEHCFESRVTGPFVPITRHQSDTVCLEYVERIFNLS